MTVEEQINALVDAMNERSLAMNMLMDQMEAAAEAGVFLTDLEQQVHRMARENVALGKQLAALHPADHPIQKVQRALEWNVNQLRDTS